MKTFRDTAGREWLVSINITTIKRVKGLCGVDLLDIGADENNIIARLMDDPVLLCNVVYAICKPQADEREISDEVFGEAMAGDAIDSATDAVLSDLVDFIPAPKRPALRKIYQKLQAYQVTAGDLAMKELDDPDIDAKMNAALEAALHGPLSINAPES